MYSGFPSIIGILYLLYTTYLAKTALFTIIVVVGGVGVAEAVVVKVIDIEILLPVPRARVRVVLNHAGRPGLVLVLSVSVH